MKADSEAAIGNVGNVGNVGNGGNGGNDGNIGSDDIVCRGQIWFLGSDKKKEIYRPQNLIRPSFRQYRSGQGSGLKRFGHWVNDQAKKMFGGRLGFDLAYNEVQTAYRAIHNLLSKMLWPT